MKNYKKFLAAGLVVTMAMGSSVVALAEDAKGTGSGTGGLDIVEQSDVFQVVVPTDSGTTFDYILDPTGVIAATKGAKYDADAVFAEDKTLYFAKVLAEDAAEGTPNYDDTSDAIKAVNKSTMDVTITVNASVAAADGITMADSKTFAEDNTAAELYLAITDSDTNNSETPITTEGVSLTSTIKALDGAYETKYVDGKYVKELKADATGFEEYSFQLTGACNPNGTWTGLDEAPPTVDVVWTIADPTVPAPEVPAGPSVTLSETGLITVSGLTPEANVVNAATDITLGVGDKLYPMDPKAVEWDTTNWDKDAGGTLGAQMTSAYSAYNGQTVNVVISLTDGSTIECSAVVNIE